MPATPTPTAVPPKALTIYAAQINPTVGALAANAALILQHYQKAAAQGADVALFPELALTGYSPEDLLLRPGFMAQVLEHIQQLCAATTAETALIFGTPYGTPQSPATQHIPMPSTLKNAAVIAWSGQLQHVAEKADLPNYGVFDEKRYFEPSPKPIVFSFKGTTIGVPICRDVWLPNVSRLCKEAGAQVLLVPNASPFERGKVQQRIGFCKQRVKETGIPLLYLNLAGGQDEVVFDGFSFAMNPQNPTNQPPTMQGFAEHASLWQLQNNALTPAEALPLYSHDDMAETYAACVLGLRDYVRKNGFSKVCLGLSGGVDSALVACICAEAVGAENTRAFFMPSPYSAKESAEDAATLAQNLNIQLDTLNISTLMETFNTTLAPAIGQPQGLTAENLQSRIRGVLLMALSNQSGALLITTGNKSEYATGYATLYGDMCGAFNPIKDLYKTDVFALSRWLNRQKEVIPERIISRPPSAELRPDQKDEDSLPPYPTLDAILKLAIEERLDAAAITAQGFEPATVAHVFSLLKRSEYKRRQAAPGVKLSRCTFGREWRYPMTNGYNFQ